MSAAERAPAPPTKRFGPSAVATPANALSFVRVVAAPLLGILVAETGPDSWLLWVLWTLLAFSDRLDGELARRHGVTRSGAFLDPLADKLLVIAALAALAGLGEVSWWPVAVIAAREVAMQAFRTYAARRGISIPARPLAKVKTLVQDFAVGLAFFPPIGGHYRDVVRVVLWVAVALTLYTGAEYLADGRRLLRSGDGQAG
ncbi:MAG: CDP-alcohol phosphatidyltransferase [Acidimicrobiaceae bacterium]|nr:CDP-alcohol phosphatidyltransferase [Acidimicrobiaceae bacterium]